MANALDLQGMPSGVQAAASRLMEAGGCVSVISYVGVAAQANQESAQAADLQSPSSARANIQPRADAAASGWCVSVISYVAGAVAQ